MTEDEQKNYVTLCAIHECIWKIQEALGAVRAIGDLDMTAHIERQLAGANRDLRVIAVTFTKKVSNGN